jgi:hypothetical protein
MRPVLALLATKPLQPLLPTPVLRFPLQMLRLNRNRAVCRGVKETRVVISLARAATRQPARALQTRERDKRLPLAIERCRRLTRR